MKYILFDEEFYDCRDVAERICECSDKELTEEYDEALNEGGPVCIGCCEFEPARILEELDPIAYGCGYDNWIDIRCEEIAEEISKLDSNECVVIYGCAVDAIED